MDRGLFLYYAYDREAAHRCFADAAARDPHLAVAQWGLALADGPDLNTPMTEAQFDVARKEIAAAVALEPGATARERSFIDALSLRFAKGFHDWQSGDPSYARAMQRMADATGDENARLLAAEALLEEGGLTWSGGELATADSRAALALVGDALRDNPTSAMANHLCVHLYDDAPDREPAQPCAQRLDGATFPPQAEHLAHMPAHYWIETGNYNAALRSSDRAYALIERLANMPNGDAHVQQYLKHDVAVGYSAAMMLDDYDAAKTWAQRMAAAYGIGFDAITALRFGDRATAYAASGPQYGDPATHGWAALLLERPKEAAVIAARIESSKETGGYITPLFLARAAEANGQPEKARQWIARAADEQRRNFSAESIPLVPASEELGQLEMRAGDRVAATSAFEQTLTLYPGDPRALAAIQALESGAASAINGAGFP